MRRRIHRKRTQKRIAAVLLGMFLISMALPCYAANPFYKLGRGLVNCTTSWIEVPKNIYEESRETNPFTGLVYGSMKGSGLCVVRTAAGTYDTGTFLFPHYDKPVLEPEFVF